jgi:hypothetical protein
MVLWSGEAGQPAQVTSTSVTVWLASLITYVTKPTAPNVARRTYGSLAGNVRKGSSRVLDHRGHGSYQRVERLRWKIAELAEDPIA